MPKKSVLITGTSQGGIGDALAQEFHNKGARVFATARNLAKVAHLTELGIEVIQLDVVDDASIAKAVESVKAATGGTLDILVNNSGGGYSIPLLDSDASIAKDMFNVNVFALVSVTQAFAPLLIKAQGTVINIGSVLGYAPVPWCGWYNASKAAANHITDNLRLELSPFGVKVILVVAGAVRTKFLENLPSTPRLPEGSVYTPGKEAIEQAMSGADFEKDALDVKLFAEGVVKNALKSKPTKHHWIGGGASTIWFASTFGWATVWDIALRSLSKLPIITQKIETAKGKQN